MKARTFTIPRTARYYFLGDSEAQVKSCWLALHGYGQLARYFLRRFDIVAEAGTLVAAPEAVARFYLDTEGKSVGASWMTREHRLDDIADNMIYIDEVYTQLVQSVHPDCRFTAFGFSQGCATLMRWILHTRPPLEALILYAGSIPDDLPYKEHHDYLRSFPVFVVYGDQDEYLTPETVGPYRAFMDQLGLRVQYHVFEGGHVVLREVLSEIRQKISSLSPSP